MNIAERMGPGFGLDKYLAPVLTAVFAGVLVSSLVAYFYTKRTVEDLAQGQLTQAISFLDREVTQQTRDMEMQVGLVAQEDVLRIALEESYLGRSARVAAQRKLSGYVTGGAFDRVYLMNSKGNLVLASDPSLANNLRVADRPYYTEAMKGHTTIQTIDVSRVSGRPILVISKPIHGPGGEVAGVVVGITHTAVFAHDLLNDTRIGNTGGAYLLSPNGVLLAEPVWASPDAFRVGELAQQFSDAADGPGTLRIHRGRDARLCMARRNRQTGWLLVVEAAEQEVLAPANRLGAVSGTISFITLALVALALDGIRRVMVSLRKSEADHRTLTELSPVGIITCDATGKPDFLNNQAKVILGLPPDSPLPEELPLEDSEGEPLTGEMSPLARVMTDRQPISGLLTWLATPQGQRKAVYLNATLLATEDREIRGVVATLEDITDRMEALQLLHESEERFSSLFRLSPDSIVLSDLESGVIVDVNDTFLDKHGFLREDVIGKTVRELGLYVNESEYDTVIDRIRNEGHIQMEARGRDKEGRDIILSLSSQVMEIGEARYRMTVARDVTERYRAEQELRENRRLLESILNTVPLSIFWKDENYAFLGCNEAFARSLGFQSPLDLIGKTDYDLAMPNENVEAYRRDDQLVMSTLTPKLRYIEPLFLPSGQRIWLETSKLPLLDDSGRAVGLLGIFQDITERMESVEKLKQSEERFSRLFRLSPEAIILVDMADQRFADVNEAFLRLSGHGSAEIIGHESHTLGFFADKAQRDLFYERLARDSHVENFEFEGVRKDGKKLMCALTCHIIDLNHRKYMLAMVRDVTELKKMQEMMVQTEKMISVGGIAAGIAHEINNPLGIVLQAAQNLVQRTRPDFQKNIDVAAKLGLDMNLLQQYMHSRKLDAFIEDIQSAAVRASAIIRHMLDFSRSSESRRKVCDLGAIIDKAVTLAGSDYDLKKSYDFKRIHIERDYADDLPTLSCTETEVEQVLLNLLRNAAQALAGMEPPVESPAISIRVRRRNDFVRIEITDNGPGIPPDVQRRVFEPFFTTKPPGVGTGLGLSVSYFIITKGHGGKMTVSSKPGTGTSFTIDLPVDDAQEQ